MSDETKIEVTLPAPSEPTPPASPLASPELLDVRNEITTLRAQLVETEKLADRLQAAENQTAEMVRKLDVAEMRLAELDNQLAQLIQAAEELTTEGESAEGPDVTLVTIPEPVKTEMASEPPKRHPIHRALFS